MADLKIDRNRLEDTLDQLRTKVRNEKIDVYTTDIIDSYMGGVHRNKGVPAGISWNAQFGKYLKRHADELGIRELSSKNPLIIDGGNTRASLWDLLLEVDNHNL
ncbi:MULTISPECIES: hypothetical protein [unclassified Brenneria]|uniref:hypothetical protein n=1 Tax=unclassified Brenneria TaxID=2634434 RepID=UPI0029C1C169|nr:MULTISPECIES: hypothetical protein [unclassified Brenneria]MDX5630734.1 hypothetical protein [Brenneria sp. L3-3Z]MDX5694214.1 hypothetical protein [Brenneria sp. L4-2C]